MRNSLTSHAQDLAGLGSLGNADTGFSIQGFDFDLRPEGGLAERDRQIEKDIIAVALEIIILFHFDQNDQMAFRPVAQTRVTLAAKSEVVARADTCRDFNLDLPVLPDSAFTGACGADILYYFS